MQKQPLKNSKGRIVKLGQEKPPNQPYYLIPVEDAPSGPASNHSPFSINQQGHSCIGGIDMVDGSFGIDTGSGLTIDLT